MNLAEYKVKATGNYETTGAFRSLTGKSEAGVIAVGGVRFRVIVCEGEIVSFIPKNKSYDRGQLYLRADGTFEPYGWIWNGKLVAACATLAHIIMPNVKDVNDLCSAVATVTCCCARCGCPLVDDLSVSRGVGPECWKRFGGKELSKMAIADRVKRGRESIA